MKIPEGLKSSIGSKILGKGAKSIASKVSGGAEGSDNTTLMFKVIAKNFMALPGIARDLNVAKQNIMQLVGLEGGKPSKDAPDSPMGSKVLSDKEAQAKLDKELAKGKLKTPTPVSADKVGTGGIFGKAKGLLGKFGIKNIVKLFSVGAVAVALANFPGEFIKEMFDGIVDSIKELASMLLDEIKTAFTGFVEDIKKWFNEVVKPILDELTVFLEKVWLKVKDFFGSIFNWFGDKIKTVMDKLQPIFDFMKSVLDKVFEVFNALKEKLAFLQPYYDSLVEKVNKVKDFLGLGEKKAEAPSVPAPPKVVAPSAPTPPKAVAPSAPTPPKAVAPSAPAPQKAAAAAAGAGAPAGPAPVVSAGKAPAMGSLDDTQKMIIRHEGIRDMPYKDSLGLWTVGVGHLIGNGKTLPPEYNRKFTQAEIMKMFDEDFDHHAAAAQKIPGYSKVNQQGQGALIDLTFNMGNSWHKGFPSFVKKLAAGDFKGAADELMYKNGSDKSKGLSDYYQQVKGRAQTIVGLIMGAGDGGTAPTPVSGGGTQVASAAPSAAPSPAPAPAPKPAAPTAAPKESAPPPMRGSIPSASGAAPAAVGGSLSSLVKTEPGVDLSKFSSEFEKRVATMAADFKSKTGKALLITSGYRSNEKQKTLWDAMMVKVGGDKAKARKLVSEPMAPLGQGRSNTHLKGLAIDINSKGAGGINTLAGPRDKPTGWLEAFGLTRPVANENWHVQGTGLPPTPDNPVNPGGPTLVAGKDGKPINLATGESEALPVEATSSDSGTAVASASTEVAAGQRAQQKPTTPIIVNAPNTNTTTIVKNESVRNPKEKKEDTGQTLFARAA